MSGGGKGGSQSTSVEIPAWLQSAAQGNLAKANEISKIGYTPYYGPDVAAMTPLQQAAISNTNLGASAFGLGGTPSPMAGMPTVQTFANGMQGYSSGGLYDQALAQLAARNPGQFAALQAPFINPQTGAQPVGVYNATPPPSSVARTALKSSYRDYNEPRQGSNARDRAEEKANRAAVDARRSATKGTK